MRSSPDRNAMPAGRAIVALGLFLLLTAGGIGASGFSDEADLRFPGVRIDLGVLKVPAPRIGDDWSYRAVDATTGEPISSYVTTFGKHIRLRWQAPALTLDAAGDAWVADRVRLSSSDRHAYEMVLHPVTREIMAESYVEWQEVDKPTDDPIGESERSQTESIHTYVRSYVVCELWLAFQDLSQSTRKGITMPPCANFWFDTIDPVHLGFAGAYSHDGHIYSLFQLDGYRGRGMHIERLVFRDDLPYPTYIGYSLYSCGLCEEEKLAFALTRFRGGSDPLSTATEPEVLSGARRMVALNDWGLDDAGVDHPYPLSQAWNDLYNDGSSGLRAHFDAHPDSITFGTLYKETVNGRSIDRQWTWTVGNRDDVIDYCVIRRDVRDDSTLPIPYGTLPIDSPGTSPCGDQSRDWPTPTRPDAVPTVDTMLPLLQTTASALGLDVGTLSWTLQPPQFENNGWTFSITGRNTTRTASGPGLPSTTPTETTERRVTIMFNDQGHVAEVSTWMKDSLSQWGPPMAAPSNEDPGLLSDAVGIEPPFWTFPTFRSTLGATAVALLAAALYWLFPHIKVGYIGLFSRVHRGNALSHDARASLLAAVEAEPGIHDRELQRRAGIARGALRHHLDKLVSTGLVERGRHGRFTGYWPAGKADRAAAARAAALRAPLAQQIHALLASEPGLSQVAVAARLGTTRQAVAYHLTKLRKAGMVADPGRSARTA